MSEDQPDHDLADAGLDEDGHHRLAGQPRTGEEGPVAQAEHRAAD